MDCYFFQVILLWKCADHRSTIVKAIELAFCTRDLTIRIATGQGNVGKLL